MAFPALQMNEVVPDAGGTHADLCVARSLLQVPKTHQSTQGLRGHGAPDLVQLPSYPNCRRTGPSRPTLLCLHGCPLDWHRAVCVLQAMNRNNEHVSAYLLAELGTSGSLDGQQRLVVKGRFLPKSFETVLRRYVNE